MKIKLQPWFVLLLASLFIGCTSTAHQTILPPTINAENNTLQPQITVFPSPTSQPTIEPIITKTQAPQPTAAPNLDLSTLSPITADNIKELKKLIEYTPTGLPELGNIHPVTISPSGQYLAYINASDEQIYLWDIKTQTIIHSYSWSNQGSPCCLINECSQAGPAFNLEETEIAMVNNQGIHVWNIASETNQIDQNSCANEDPISPQPVYTSLIFSPDGKKLFSGSAFAGAKFTIWDAKNGELLSQSSTYGNAIWDLILSENNQYLISRDSGGHLSFYDPYSGMEIMVPPDLDHEEFRGIICPQSSTDFAVSPDGKTLAVFCQSDSSSELIIPECESSQKEPDPLQYLNCGYLQFTDIQSWEKGSPLNDLRHKTGGISFNHDGSLLVYGTNQTEITVEFLESQTQSHIFQLNRFDNPSTELISVKFSPDGRILVIQFANGQIQIWGIKNG